MKPTVLIVDDHPLFRRGVAQLLAMAGEVTIVGEAANGAAALEQARATEPDLILLDLHLKAAGGARESGIDVLRALKRENPSRRVVVLTVSDAPDDLVQAIRAGADGYLLKDMEPEELLARLRSALAGDMVISPSLAGSLAAALRDGRPGKSPRTAAALTEREGSVLRLISAGLPNKDIARELAISEATVKVHLKHLMRKLNFRSRVEAAVWMAENAGRGREGATAG